MGFQSHLGSIAALWGCGPPQARFPLSIPPWFDCGWAAVPEGHGKFWLSIPPWFDCGRAYASPPLSSEVLSIPPWFDCGAVAPTSNRCLLLLSIPPWFDCGGNYVRLEAMIDVTFNPTLVRLRRAMRSRTATLQRPSFQSHLGSIAAGQGVVHDQRPPFFQSHLGSIAAGPYRSCKSLTISAFNPTLVRLRPRASTSTFSACPLSIPPWFDCGLIRSPEGFWLDPLSIPPWFDCGLPVMPPPSSFLVLSIPPWFDCGECVLERNSSEFPLSIPPWFDCGWPCQSPELAAVIPFNPTSVRLRRIGVAGDAGHSPPFQSHLGSIAASIP